MGLVLGEGRTLYLNDSQDYAMESNYVRGFGVEKHPVIKYCVRREKASIVII